jgi:predicted DNA-binding protein (MmcQ/YjbR family)
MKTDDSESVRALVAELRKLCAALPAAEEYVMVHHPAFRVGKKPFLIAGMQHGGQAASLSVNLGPEMQHQLLGDARFAKTPYIGQHGWVTIARGSLAPRELSLLVTESWRRIANKKQLAELDGPTGSKTAKKTGTTVATRKRTARTAGAATRHSR